MQRIEVEVRNFAGEGRLVLLGITELLEYVDAPGHIADLARYRARSYTMPGQSDRDLERSYR